MARKTEFNKNVHVKQVKRLMGLGYTKEEAAKHMCVSIATFYSWMKKHPDFLKAVETGLLEKVKTVTAVAYKKAKGYDYFEETWVYEPPKDPKAKTKIVNGKKVSNGRPKKGKWVLSKKVTKHAPPDSGMIQYILNNRDSANWKNSMSIDANVRTEYVVIPPEIPGKKKKGE